MLSPFVIPEVLYLKRFISEKRLFVAIDTELSVVMVCRVCKLRQPDKCSDSDTNDERLSDWNEATESAAQKTKRVQSS